MSDIYADLQALLDEALADLATDTGYLPPNDHVYDADLDLWIDLAHSLKARMYMHWAEVNAGNYALALAEAQLGIASGAGDYHSVHSTKETEANAWYQFYRERDDYIRAGAYMVDLLTDRNDPRLPIYFSEDADGGYSGSGPGEGLTAVSSLGDLFLAKDHSYDILSYEETQFIIAECAYEADDEATAITAVNNALAAAEAKYGLADEALGRYDATTTGEDLFDAIMEEKYIALFLNIEVFNDWKRTKRPVLVPYGGGDPETSIPHRLYYADDSRQTNPNCPAPADQPFRNENDPS
jgi:hypothetical protein